MEDTHVTQVYNEIASHFDKTRAYRWSWITTFLEKTESNSKIVDIGCGSGRNMDYPDRQFTGVDSSLSFVEICRKKGLEAHTMDMCKMPFKDNAFDYSISIASFHHLATEERRIQALKEMKRITKKDILLSVWSMRQPLKTRVTFDSYGDTMVPWVNMDKKYNRYYYLFRLQEIMELFDKCDLKIKSHIWDCGNEVFVLE